MFKEIRKTQTWQHVSRAVQYLAPHSSFIKCEVVFDSMAEGPLGRQIRLLDDEKKVLVLLGIDGQSIPRDIRIDLQSSVKQSLLTMQEEGGNDIIDEINLTVGENVTDPQRKELGSATYTQQYEVKTKFKKLPQDIVNAIHNSTLDTVKDLGFNVTRARTKVV